MPSTVALLCLSAITAVLAAPFHDFDSNIAYKSPSKRVAELEIPLASVHRRLAKRAPSFWTGNVTFPYSVASGDPESDSIVLWTKVGHSHPPTVSTDKPSSRANTTSKDCQWTCSPSLTEADAVIGTGAPTSRPSASSGKSRATPSAPPPAPGHLARSHTDRRTSRRARSSPLER